MSQQPQTLWFALLDSPVGLLAWNAQLLGEELDRGLRPHERDAVLADRDRRLRGSAYYENAHADPATEPTTVPIGLAAFAGDFSGIRRFAKRDHTNIVRWTTFEGAAGTSRRTRRPISSSATCGSSSGTCADVA